MNKMLPLIMILGVSACFSGNSYEGSTGFSFRSLSEQFKPKVEAALTRTDIESMDDEVILLEIQKMNLYTLGKRHAVNGVYHTYVTDAGQSFTFRDGHLVATRGLAHDLMSADYKLDAQNQRGYRFLSGDNKLHVFKFTCQSEGAKVTEQIEILEHTYSVVRSEDICHRPTKAFKNRYWHDADSGKIRQSEQWFSHQYGHVRIYVLN